MEKSNVCGIVGLSTGWAFPISGVVLGIIALARKEPSKWIGVTSIVAGALAWLMWAAVLI
jgi:hypothetical protein